MTKSMKESILTRFSQHAVFYMKAHGGELALLCAMGGLSSICSFLACSRTNGEIHTGSRSSGCGASAKCGELVREAAKPTYDNEVILTMTVFDFLIGRHSLPK